MAGVRQQSSANYSERFILAIWVYTVYFVDATLPTLSMLRSLLWLNFKWIPINSYFKALGFQLYTHITCFNLVILPISLTNIVFNSIVYILVIYFNATNILHDTTLKFLWIYYRCACNYYCYNNWNINIMCI